MRMRIIFLLIILVCSRLLNAQSEDPYLWLEEIDGKRSLEFAEKQSKITVDKLSLEKTYQPIYTKSLEIYNSADRIASPAIYGEFVYNFWQDKDHVRGIWRRSAKAAYIKGNPEWEVLLDLDEMSKKDNINWVFKRVDGSYPKYDRFMISLSKKGGGDVVVVMEFDVTKKSFIKNGFYIDESKALVGYLDENTLVVIADFGEGSLSASGWSRQVKLWKRGTSIQDAQLICEGEKTELGCRFFIGRIGSEAYVMIERAITFYNNQLFAWKDNKLIRMDIPYDSRAFYFLSNNQVILQLESDWTVDGATHRQGSLVGLNFTSLLKGQKKIELILQPDEFTSIYQILPTRNKLLVNVLTNVNNKLYIYSFAGEKWEREEVSTPDFGAITILTADEFSDSYFFNFASFLVPTTLYLGDAHGNSLKPYQSLPAYFDAGKYKVDQYRAKSRDGTLVPYFIVYPRTMQYNSKNPALVLGYGGFSISPVPVYSGITGTAWLENGGVYVMANIRGGGEFGPRWHKAAIKETKQNSYDDFHAVAEDLIARKITSAQNLGITGRSNGGLLVGAAFTQRPELYNAVVCGVPLLDMKRYTRLAAGSLWTDEYGDPDKPEEWDYIRKYSPYQNLKSGVKYPEVFIYTATRDDRVHPGHARKMAAKMIDMGHPVYYYESTEGAHAFSSTTELLAKIAALQYTYLLMKLKN